MSTRNYFRLFPKNQHLYSAIWDVDSEIIKKCPFEKHAFEALYWEDLKELNLKKYGIYHCSSFFNTRRRKKDFVSQINYWPIDLDGHNKKKQRELITSLTVQPAYIVESKAGYHVYYKAKEAKVENYEMIMKKLITLLDGDTKCKDCTRLLRVPGFNHWKTNEPYEVKEIYCRKENEYYEDDLLDALEIPLRNLKLKEMEERRLQYAYQPKQYEPQMYTTNLQTTETGYKPIDKKLWGKGERNDGLNKLAYRLRQTGKTQIEIETAVYDANLRNCDPPLSKREIYRTILKH